MKGYEGIWRDLKGYEGIWGYEGIAVGKDKKSEDN